MKRKSVAVLMLAASIMLSTTGCGAGTIVGKAQAVMSQDKDDDGSKIKDKASEGKKKKKHKDSDEARETVMIYMVGSNLESEVGAATKDLQEMALSKYDPADMNVVVCAGGANKWWNTSVADDGLSMYIMENEDIVPVYDMENDNMAEADTLTEFINEAKDMYPAENYSLVLWNHGGGAVIGYGADETHNNQMLSVKELGKAISKSDVCDDGKFEWIGFDACMMGMIEVADTLKDSANYMIASEEVEAQDGWNYSVLGDITENEAYSGDEAGELITKAYGKFYKDNYKFVPDYTLSCIDLSKIEDVTDALSDFSKKADGALVDGKYSKIARARDNSKSFGGLGMSSLYDYIDLGCFSGQVKSLFPKESEKLEKAIKGCVVHNETNISRASGLSVYFPYENLNSMEAMIDKYDTEEYNSDYTSFIHDFKDTLNGEDLSEWTVTDDAPTVDESDKSKYSIKLSDEEVENFSKAYTSIWEKDAYDEKGENYNLWIQTQSSAPDKDGNVYSDFDGRIFFLTDNSGDKVPIFAIQTEAAEDYSEFVTYLNKGALTDSNNHNVAMHFRVDKEHPTGVITGIYKLENGGDLSVPNKTVDTIEDGDRINVDYFARKIKFNDDGTVAPFDTWEETSYLGAYMNVEGELKITFEKPAMEHDYIGVFRIVDTQSKDHLSDYTEIHVDGEEGNGWTVYEEAFGVSASDKNEKKD